MKKSLILIVGLMFLPFAAFAETLDSYSREPAGDFSGNMHVTAQVSDIDPVNSLYQAAVLHNAGGYVFYPDTNGACVPVSGDPETYDETFAPPVGTYDYLALSFYSDSGCTASGAAVTLSSDTFTVSSSTEPEATTTPAVDHYKDYLFISGVVIFLLSFPVWVRMFGKPSGI